MKSKLKETILSIVHDLQLQSNSKILDIGCGTGALSNLLSNDGYKVTGIDISPKKVESAINNNHLGQAGADFRVGNVENLEFNDNSFDVVLAIGILEYIRWQRWAFQEIRRIMKPGGYLLIVSANRLSFINLINPSWYVNEISAKIKTSFQHISRPPPEANKVTTTINRKKSSSMNPDNIYEPQLIFRIKENLQLTGYHIIFQDSIGFGPLYQNTNLNKLKSGYRRVRSFQLSKGTKSVRGQFGNELILLAQKRKISTYISRHTSVQNFVESKQRFESEHAHLFERRRAWLKRFPLYEGGKPDIFDRIIGDRNRILVVSPHPDDEMIGCGGTLIKLLEWGKQVTVLQLTDGRNTAALKNADDETKRNARLIEAATVSDYIGYSDLVLWKMPDGEIWANEDNIKRFSELLDSLMPQIIFTPFFNDAHRDHRDANELLNAALQKMSSETEDLLIMGYECWSMLPAGAISIITDQFEKKSSALMKYKIAMRVVDYVRFCENLNAYHHHTHFEKAGYAEAFFPTDKETFIRLQKAQQVININNG